MKKYSEVDIREAVDIVIGDDGMRAKEVIALLKTVAHPDLLFAPYILTLQ